MLKYDFFKAGYERAGIFRMCSCFVVGCLGKIPALWVGVMNVVFGWGLLIDFAYWSARVAYG